MEILSTPRQYLFNLETLSSSEATRLWRRKIKEKWDYKCAYCGSEKNITIDHILARSKGGEDNTKNMVCCCHSCNHDKGHQPWKDWYFSQEFYDIERYERIKEWMEPDPPINLFAYRPNRNNVT